MYYVYILHKYMDLFVFYIGLIYIYIYYFKSIGVYFMSYNILQLKTSLENSTKLEENLYIERGNIFYL